MITNADCTVYRLEGDAYLRIYLHAVNWQQAQGSLVNDGRHLSEQARSESLIFLPFSLGFQPKLEDIFIRGDCPIPAKTATKKALTSTGEDRMVARTIARLDNGSDAMGHWEVSG